MQSSGGGEPSGGQHDDDVTGAGGSGRGESNAAAASTAESPPGPTGVPVLGVARQFRRDPWGFYDGLRAYGDVASFRIASYRFTTLLHPDHVERVLVTEPGRFRKPAFMSRAAGFDGGLLLSEGERWRRQRTFLQPMFYRERVETYADAMTAQAAATVDGWRDSAVVDVGAAFSDLTLDILADALFDLDIERERRAVRRLARAIAGIGEAGDVSAMVPPWVPTPSNVRLWRASREFDRTVEALVARRREGAAERDDMLSRMLAATYPDGSRMDAVTVNAQLRTFLFAGHETSATALTFAAHALATHPDVAERLRTEVDRVVGDDTPVLADLPDLPVTKRVVTETLRRYPPAPVIFRQATEDVRFDGYVVEEGSLLTLPQFMLHRDPRFYDDPDDWRPSRWDGDLERRLPDYAYFPFGGGPRSCIGNRFARLELELVVATLASRVRFEAESPSLDPVLGVTLDTEGPVELRVRKR